MYEVDGNMMFIEEFQEELINEHCQDIYEEVIEDKLKSIDDDLLELIFNEHCQDIYEEVIEDKLKQVIINTLESV